MWIRRKDVVAWRAMWGIIGDKIDGLRRDLDALREASREAASQPPVAPAPVDVALVARMLDSIEQLSGKFYQVWERDRALAREQRKGARKIGMEKQAAAASERDALAAQLPPAVESCSSCMDLIEGGSKASSLDQLRHSREEHDALYSQWLTRRQ